MFIKKVIGILCVGLGLFGTAQCQSLELMPGTERFFADVQWLKPLDKDYKFSLFSRTRATVDYENNTDIFSGAYLNYTTKSGIGGSLVGRISSGGAGAELGAHYFKKHSSITFFGLASMALAEEFSYSWFSIFRYRPSLNQNWKLFTGVELYSLFNTNGHVFSVQRLRAGLDRNSYQFGLALNLSGSGADYTDTFTNPGIFIRKEFN